MFSPTVPIPWFWVTLESLYSYCQPPTMVPVGGASTLIFRTRSRRRRRAVVLDELRAGGDEGRGEAEGLVGSDVEEEGREEVGRVDAVWGRVGARVSVGQLDGKRPVIVIG